VAQANRDRADRHLARVAADVARRRGYPDIRALVLAGIAAGASLAAISREAGLHKDWLSRHLPHLDQAAADAARLRSPDRLDAPWRPALQRLGFRDVPGYLRERHLVQHRTVNAMAAAIGVSLHAVESALRRHGLPRIAHAAKRHAAQQRAAEVAAGLGYASIAEYIRQHRRVHQSAQGRRLDLERHLGGIRSAPDLAAPARGTGPAASALPSSKQGR
jgi:hypothetical protein